MMHFYFMRQAMVCNKYFTSDTFFSRTLLPLVWILAALQRMLIVTPSHPISAKYLDKYSLVMIGRHENSNGIIIIIIIWGKFFPSKNSLSIIYDDSLWFALWIDFSEVHFCWNWGHHFEDSSGDHLSIQYWYFLSRRRSSSSMKIKRENFLIRNCLSHFMLHQTVV